jgi:hypothetical protein
MKITFTAAAAEIAEQEPWEFSACSACSAVHFSQQVAEATEKILMCWLGALGVLGGELVYPS